MAIALRTGPLTKDTSAVAVGLAQIRVGNSATSISNVMPCLTENDSIGALADTKLQSSAEYWKLESGFPALEDLSIPLKEGYSLECSFKEITPKNLAIARGIDPTASLGTSFTATAMSIVLSAAGAIDSAKVLTTPTTSLVDTYTVTWTSATGYTVEGFANGELTGTGTKTADSAFTKSGQAIVTIPANTFTGTYAAGDRCRFSIIKNDFGDNKSGSIGLGGLKAPDYVRMEAFYTFPDRTHFMHIIFPRANVTSNMEMAFASADNANPSITFEAKRADGGVAGGHSAWNEMPLGRILFTTA